MKVPERNTTWGKHLYLKGIISTMVALSSSCLKGLCGKKLCFTLVAVLAALICIRPVTTMNNIVTMNTITTMRARTAGSMSERA